MCLLTDLLAAGSPGCQAGFSPSPPPPPPPSSSFLVNSHSSPVTLPPPPHTTYSHSSQPAGQTKRGFHSERQQVETESRSEAGEVPTSTGVKGGLRSSQLPGLCTVAPRLSWLPRTVPCTTPTVPYTSGTVPHCTAAHGADQDNPELSATPSILSFAIIIAHLNTYITGFRYHWDNHPTSTVCFRVSTGN